MRTHRQVLHSATETIIDPDELALRKPQPPNEALPTLILLVFGILFTSLCFWAGWKEAAAYRNCGIRGVVSVGRHCSTVAPKDQGSAIPQPKSGRSTAALADPILLLP
jgi:hypothetical protein